MNMSTFAILALVPMITGPLPETEKTITASLCNGGSISIPLGDGDREPTRDCHQKACHAANCRGKSKQGKLI